MNINFLIPLAAIIPAILIVLLAKKYNWNDKISYNYTIVIIGIIGWIVFTYSLILHFNITLLLINIFLLFGIIQKAIKIRQIKKSGKSS
jgi:TctA family transporter